MSDVASFVFSPFHENTYVVFDDTKSCIIVDPGCYTAEEKQHLVDFISANDLRPVRLINTHCHIDHVFGNKFIAEKYNLPLEIHKGELPILEMLSTTARKYGIPNVDISPEPSVFLEEGDVIEFGNTKLDILFTPGHSPASISFFCEKDRYVLGGDVLFENSIGRTDLPGGDMATLLKSIRQKLFPLGDDVTVYSGHGNPTNIGKEKTGNPFLQGDFG